jgi:hypothetical protein
MVSGVCAVQIKRREFTKEVIWGAPNLHMRLPCHSNVPTKLNHGRLKSAGVGLRGYLLSIRRELDRPNGVVKVEVV